MKILDWLIDKLKALPYYNIEVCYNCRFYDKTKHWSSAYPDTSGICNHIVYRNDYGMQIRFHDRYCTLFKKVIKTAWHQKQLVVD